MYLEIDEDMPSHPKSTRLCAALQNGVAWAYMIKLWSWSRKYQKDGDLSAYDPAEIEFAVGWTLADGKFYAAAVKVGFIDEAKDADGSVTSRTLHNWMKRTGGAIKRMEAESASKREWRLHAKGKCGGAADCRHCAAVVAAEEGCASASDGCPADATEDVLPTSQPDKTSQAKPSPDPDLSPPPEISLPDLTRARVSIAAELIEPYRNGQKNFPVGAFTMDFTAVYKAYASAVRGDARDKAALAWHEISAVYPGGEAAMRKGFEAWFPVASKRHPYRGDHSMRPFLASVIAERRWEDDQSAPDDVETPAATTAASMGYRRLT